MAESIPGDLLGGRPLGREVGIARSELEVLNPTSQVTEGSTSVRFEVPASESLTDLAGLRLILPLKVTQAAGGDAAIADGGRIYASSCLGDSIFSDVSISLNGTEVNSQDSGERLYANFVRRALLGPAEDLRQEATPVLAVQAGHPGNGIYQASGASIDEGARWSGVVADWGATPGSAAAIRTILNGIFGTSAAPAAAKDVGELITEAEATARYGDPATSLRSALGWAIWTINPRYVEWYNFAFAEHLPATADVAGAQLAWTEYVTRLIVELRAAGMFAVPRTTYPQSILFTGMPGGVASGTLAAPADLTAASWAAAREALEDYFHRIIFNALLAHANSDQHGSSVVSYFSEPLGSGAECGMGIPATGQYAAATAGIYPAPEGNLPAGVAGGINSPFNTSALARSKLVVNHNVAGGQPLVLVQPLQHAVTSAAMLGGRFLPPQVRMSIVLTMDSRRHARGLMGASRSYAPFLGFDSNALYQPQLQVVRCFMDEAFREAYAAHMLTQGQLYNIFRTRVSTFQMPHSTTRTENNLCAGVRPGYLCVMVVPQTAFAGHISLDPLGGGPRSALAQYNRDDAAEYCAAAPVAPVTKLSVRWAGSELPGAIRNQGPASQEEMQQAYARYRLACADTSHPALSWGQWSNAPIFVFSCHGIMPPKGVQGPDPASTGSAQVRIEIGAAGTPPAAVTAAGVSRDQRVIVCALETSTFHIDAARSVKKGF
eukprot:m.282469 g.282469  ORF g.282469 m.282469 type:complete len:719 (+) comp11111_c0_seq19:3546-5702(+)